MAAAPPPPPDPGGDPFAHRDEPPADPTDTQTCSSCRKSLPLAMFLSKRHRAPTYIKTCAQCRSKITTRTPRATRPLPELRPKPPVVSSAGTGLSPLSAPVSLPQLGSRPSTASPFGVFVTARPLPVSTTGNVSQLRPKPPTASRAGAFDAAEPASAETTGSLPQLTLSPSITSQAADLATAGAASTETTGTLPQLTLSPPIASGAGAFAAADPESISTTGSLPQLTLSPSITSRAAAFATADPAPRPIPATPSRAPTAPMFPRAPRSPPFTSLLSLRPGSGTTSDPPSSPPPNGPRYFFCYTCNHNRAIVRRVRKSPDICSYCAAGVSEKDLHLQQKWCFQKAHEADRERFVDPNDHRVEGFSCGDCLPFTTPGDKKLPPRPEPAVAVARQPSHGTSGWELWPRQGSFVPDPFSLQSCH